LSQSLCADSPLGIVCGADANALHDARRSPHSGQSTTRAM
jgi:hypothetical protein